MRIAGLVVASLAVFAAASMWSGALAVPSQSEQKAPTAFRLPSNDPTAEKACSDKGGAVSTDQDGMRMCNMKRACPAPGGATRTTKLDPNDPGAAKKCQDSCGTVSTAADGSKVCTKPDGA
jgi:hypothetical protein